MSPAEYRKWEDLMQTKEELHPDLADHMENTGGALNWTCLKHPLVFAVPYIEVMNAYYNECLRYKRDRLVEAQVEKKWNSYIFLHERPYRMDAFWRIRRLVTDEEYWTLLGNIWTDTEAQWQVRLLLLECMRSERPGRAHMMKDREKELLAALPDEFTVFRGHQAKNRRGMSWTLSYTIARWFAQRFAMEGHSGTVSEGTVKKSDVWAVFTGRNEYEVAAHPVQVTSVRTVRKLARSAFLKTMLTQATRQFVLGPFSCHGPWHWDKVERNAMILCWKVPQADVLVARLFAIFHDCKRTDENTDPEHGHRAADYLTTIRDKLSITDEQFSKLQEACKDHNEGQVSTDPTIGVCWDADRLDLLRVGIVPDPKLLSTEQAKTWIGKV